MPIAHLSRQIRPPNGRLLGGDEVAFAPDSEALRMRYEHLAIREEVLRERETAVRDREAAAERRETAAERREVAAERKEAGLCQREADLRQREERREADLSRREELLDGFARASGIDRAQMGSSSAWERSRSHFHSSSAFPAANSKRRHADPMDDVQALYESYQVLGGVVPLGVLVAQVEALQQAATRLLLRIHRLQGVLALALALALALGLAALGLAALGLPLRYRGSPLSLRAEAPDGRTPALQMGSLLRLTLSSPGSCHCYRSR